MFSNAFQRRAGREAEYVDFVAARRTHLRRIAYAICGDWHLADDLVQDALVKLYVAWPRVQADGNPEAYVRQILVRVNIDRYRARSRRPRDTELTEGMDRQAPTGLPVEERSELFTALQGMPEMQRKTVVLRHWLGLSVEETAHELGIGTGTVKSHTARGLQALRQMLEPADHDIAVQPRSTTLRFSPARQRRPTGRRTPGPRCASRSPQRRRR